MRKTSTIDNFLSDCESLKSDARTNLVATFFLQIKDHSDDEFEKLLLCNTNLKPKEIFKKLLFYTHPDKHSNATEEQKKLVSIFFVKVLKIQIKFKERTQRLKDNERFEKTSNEIISEIFNFVNEIDDAHNKESNKFSLAKHDDFTIMKKMEKGLFILLKVHGSILSNQVHEALVHTYGKILQYLIRWGVEYQKDWVISNIRGFTNHCQLLAVDINRAGALAAFESALRVNISIDEESNAWLESVMGEAITENKQRERTDNISRVINVASGIFSSTMAVGSATNAFAAGATAGGAATAGGVATILTGPLGWTLLAAATIAICTSQCVVSEKRIDARDEDRHNYYKLISDGIKKDVKIIISAVKQEMDYYLYRQKSLELSKIALIKIDQELAKQREELSNKNKITMTQDELELLHCLDEHYQTKQLQRNMFFSEEERNILTSIGITDVDNITANEADDLREAFLTGKLDDEAIKLLQDCTKEQQHLTAPKAPLLISDAPSLTVFNNAKNTKQSDEFKVGKICNKRN